MIKDLKKWFCQMCGSGKHYYAPSKTVWTKRSKDKPIVVCLECYDALIARKLIVRSSV